MDVAVAVLVGGAAIPGIAYACYRAAGLYKDRASAHATAQEGHKVLVTGSTRGLGFALADEFLRLGDDVVVSSRSEEASAAAARRLQDRHPGRKVRARACDVRDAAATEALVDFTAGQLGRVDIVVCNAGVIQEPKAGLAETPPGMLEAVVGTNLLGSMHTARGALRVMRAQPSGGRIFFMDGAGARGNATPQNAAYGASKRALTQLKDSLAAEMRGTGISVHMTSPGMVATDLLLGGAKDARAARFINILAEEPAVVARWLAPCMRGARGTGQYIRFLTVPGVLWRMLTASRRRGRFLPEAARSA